MNKKQEEHVDGFDLGDVHLELFVAAWNPQRRPPARVEQPSCASGPTLSIDGVVVARLKSFSWGGFSGE